MKVVIRKKKDDQPKDKYQILFPRKNQDVLSKHYRNLVKNDGDDADLHELPTSNKAMKRAVSRKASLKEKGNPTKLIFDDDGVPYSL